MLFFPCFGWFGKNSEIVILSGLNIPKELPEIREFLISNEYEDYYALNNSEFNIENDEKRKNWKEIKLEFHQCPNQKLHSNENPKIGDIFEFQDHKFILLNNVERANFNAKTDYANPGIDFDFNPKLKKFEKKILEKGKQPRICPDSSIEFPKHFAYFLCLIPMNGFATKDNGFCSLDIGNFDEKINEFIEGYDIKNHFKLYINSEKFNKISEFDSKEIQKEKKEEKEELTIEELKSEKKLHIQIEEEQESKPKISPKKGKKSQKMKPKKKINILHSPRRTSLRKKRTKKFEENDKEIVSKPRNYKQLILRDILDRINPKSLEDLDEKRRLTSNFNNMLLKDEHLRKEIINNLPISTLFFLMEFFSEVEITTGITKFLDMDGDNEEKKRQSYR